MKYKLVTCDIDGTLLNDKGEISPKNKAAIQSLQALGVQFIIATGRNDILAKSFVQELGLDTPIIGCNGASVRNIQTGELFVLNEIDKSKLKELFSFLEQQEDTQYNAFSMSNTFYPQKMYDYAIERQGKYFRIFPREDFADIVVSDTQDIIDQPDPIIKICTFSETEKHSYALNQKLKDFDFIEAIRPSAFVVDIIKKDASKGNAMLDYAKTQGIRPEETIAIGDGENDISMLQAAGLSIAMENGAKAIFQYADMVTDSNNNDGVANALHKIFAL